jgi:hypothetical protein
MRSCQSGLLSNSKKVGSELAKKVHWKILLRLKGIAVYVILFDRTFFYFNIGKPIFNTIELAPMAWHHPSE